MDLIVIVVIWVIFAIVGAIVKNVKKSQAEQGDRNNRSKYDVEPNTRSIPNKTRPPIDNPRDDDKEALANLQNTLKKKKNKSTKKKNLNIQVTKSAIDNSKYNNIDSSYDDNIYEESVSDFGFGEGIYIQPVAEIDNNFSIGIDDEIYKIGVEEESNCSSSYRASNMFEQAVIYEAIFNRKGKKIGRR